MHEVSCRLFLMLEAGCAARGIPGERLVEGTRLPLARMRDASQRLSWDEFTALCERAAELVGSPAGLEDVGAIAIQAPAASPLRSLAGLFTGPTSVYRLGAVWFAPMMVYNLHFDFEQLGRNRVRVTIDVPPPYAPNEAFMHLTRGAIRAAPQLVGKPEATVEARITPQHATYDITLPARAPLRKRVRRALRVLLNANMVIDELAAQQRSIRESALARERLEHDFRRVIDGLPDGVLIHSGGVIRYANPAWLSYLGLPPGTDLAGRHATEFLHADDPARQARPFLGAGRHGSGGDLRLQRADGSTVLLEAAAAQPVEFDGPATLLSARDVTERKQTELQVALTDRMVAVGTLAAGAAHEINNPLSYVLANLRQIGRVLARLSDRLSGESLSDLLAMLDDAREGAERVRDVVGGLAAFSRADDAELGPVDVHTVLERALKMASNEIRHRARLVRVYGDVRPVRANEVRLAQVFLNLLVNAAQAIPVGRADVHEIRVATRVEGGDVLVEIRDTGQGIPPELRARVFDPFFTTKPLGTGTGLGLAICHGIVTGLGGTITLDDAPGGGTVVVVSLPAAAARPRPAPDLDALPAAPLSGARILIVDDEPRVASALQRALEGHDVTALRDGRSALDLLSSDPSFDVIFCDLMMPEVSGMDFYAQVATRRPGLEQRIVFMTGGAFTPAARDFLRLVDNACLEKPFRVEQVLRLIEKITTPAATPAAPP